MTDPYTFLSGLKADPTDPHSRTLIVGRGDLTSDEAADVTGPDYANRAYGLLLEPGDARTFEYADQTTEQLTVVDVVFEMRCQASPTAEQQAAMLALYMAASEMPRFVTHLMPGVPLYKRLVYEGGLGRPRVLTEPQNWLAAGLRFAAHWRANY